MRLAAAMKCGVLHRGARQQHAASPCCCCCRASLLARALCAGEVSRSVDPDTKQPIGPERVWPGGLAMSRTIGDAQAPQVRARARGAWAAERALQCQRVPACTPVCMRCARARTCV
jgi:hypothetical protein